MSSQETIIEANEYRLILVLPKSRRVLSVATIDGYHAPVVTVPSGTRKAHALQKEIQRTWNISVLILNVLPATKASHAYVFAEVLERPANEVLRPIPFSHLALPEASEQQRQELGLLFEGTAPANGPIAFLGWIDEAIAWVESATNRKISSKANIEQYNGGGGFCLLRFHMDDNREYWLKATGEPNTHEPSITVLLSKLCPEYLPQVISVRPEWNAWLASGEAQPMVELPTEPYALFRFLEDAVGSMAELQMRTVGHRLDLLEAGAFNQEPGILLRDSEELFRYLEEAMSLQTSIKARPLEKSRLQEIRVIFEDACHRMEEIGLPDTIVHGDLNWGNIAIGHDHCRFIDWSEAYVGSPLTSLQHLLLLNKVEDQTSRRAIHSALQDRYRKVLLAMSSSTAMAEAFAYMPLLAVASSLYGRGDWFRSARRHAPNCLSYARSLARHMDRAAREFVLPEVSYQ